jgi:hypothetical protein
MQAVNTQGLCGRKDWRMPTRQELRSLLSYDLHDYNIKPSIDSAYFPNTLMVYFWSATPRISYPGLAWSVSFNGGDSGEVLQPIYTAVRLVRGGQ